MNKKKLLLYLAMILSTESIIALNINSMTHYENTFNDNRHSIKSFKLLSNITLNSSWIVIDSNVTAASSLDAVINNYIASGNTRFYIKDGTYNINNSINVNIDNVIIYGQSKENTKIIQPNTGKNTIEVIGNNVQVSNLTIDNIQGEIAFTSKNSNNVTLEDCIIHGSPNNSAVAFWGTTGVDDIIAIQNSNLTSSNIIQRNTIYSHPSSTQDGLVFMKQINGSIKNNTMIGSRIAFYLCRNSEVSYNTIKDSTTTGIRVTVPAYDNKISNNIIDNTLASGICVVRHNSGATPFTYRASNIEISNNTITNSRYFGIEISNLKDSIIANNTIDNIDFDGIYLLYADNLTVTHNIISDIGLTTGNPSSNIIWPIGLNSGIFVDYLVSNSYLDYNQIINLYNNCVHGIKIQSGGLNISNFVRNNAITGDFSTGIAANTGADEYTTVSDNVINLNTIPAPTNLTELAGIDNIILSWNPVVGATEYEVDVDGDIKSNITNINYTKTGLTSNRSYQYRVRAIIGLSGGNWSNFATATTLPPPIPNTTTGSSVVVTPPTPNTTTGPSVVVTPPTPNTTTGPSVVVIPPTPNTTTGPSVVITPHPPNTTTESHGNTHHHEINTTTGASGGKLPAPTNLTTIASVNKIIINWELVLGATGYDIEVNGNIINNGIITSYMDTYLKNNTNYRYRVRAIGGIWSNYITATTLLTSQPQNPPIEFSPNLGNTAQLPDVKELPQKTGTLPQQLVEPVNFEKTSSDPINSILIPTNILATPQVHSITITWNAISESTSYDIEVDGKILDNGNNTNYVHADLTSNTYHSYRVRVKGMEWSEIFSAKTLLENNTKQNNVDNIMKSNSSIFHSIKNVSMYKILLIASAILLVVGLSLMRFFRRLH